MNGSKRYKTQIAPLAIILVVGFIFVLLMNLDEASTESLKSAGLVGFIGISLLLFVSANSYVEIEDEKLKQKEWFIFSKRVSISNIKSIEYNPKYRWVFGYTGYLLFFTHDSDKPVIALHANSYAKEVMSEMLADIKEQNPDILLDNQVEEIKSGKNG